MASEDAGLGGLIGGVPNKLTLWFKALRYDRYLCWVHCVDPSALLFICIHAAS